MKRYTLLLLLAVSMVIVAFAEIEYKYVIKTANGEKTEYLESEIKDVYCVYNFEDGRSTLTIVKNNNQTDIYDNDEIVVDTIPNQKIKAVDLGLSVKWAPMNIGAEKPSDYGEYYAWGETICKLGSYDLDVCKWDDVLYPTLVSRGVIDSNGNLTPKYDAATVNWGPSWRMPTRDEIEELIDKCRWTWATRDGKTGYNVTGPNGNSIFLPAAGYIEEIGVYQAGRDGSYWGSTAQEEYAETDNSYSLYFYESSTSCEYCSRIAGFPIRPVAK